MLDCRFYLLRIGKFPRKGHKRYDGYGCQFKDTKGTDFLKRQSESGVNFSKNRPSQNSKKKISEFSFSTLVFDKAKNMG